MDPIVILEDVHDTSKWVLNFLGIIGTLNGQNSIQQQFTKNLMGFLLQFYVR